MSDDTSGNDTGVALREGRWWFYVSIDGKRVELGPYTIRETAAAALAIRRRMEASKAVKGQVPSPQAHRGGSTRRT
jgi:hypothetical protein